MTQIKLNLTVVQKRKLLNGHTVQLDNSQIGRGANIIVDDKTYKRLMRASNAGKGARISASPEMIMSIQGAGFKSVMKKAVKGAKKVFNEDVKPVVKKEAIKFLHETVRPGIDKQLKKGREKMEQRLEDYLIEKIDPENKDPEIKALIQDGITASSALLSRKNAEVLDRLEEKVDETLQGMGLVKGQHYVVKGGMVVLQGAGIKSFLKKAGKALKKVATSKPVRNVVKQLARQGVASLTSAVAGPVAGEAVGAITGNLVDQGVDAGLDAVEGAGIMKNVKRTVGKGSAMDNIKRANRIAIRNAVAGGALYVPMGRGVSTPVVGKLSLNDRRYYL